MDQLEIDNNYDDQVLGAYSVGGAVPVQPKYRPGNPSGLRPRGHAVLVEPYEPEVKSSLLVIPDSVRGSLQVLEQRAVLVEAGPCAWIDEPEPRALPSEKVMITKYAGVMVQGPKDGKQYRLVNDRDIYCVIEEQEGSHD